MQVGILVGKGVIREAIVAETIKIPLFPLGVVLLPMMRLPLHIFEERYKQMISECLAEDKPFGIVLFDGASIHPVGCMAHITEVLNTYDDGRMDIMTMGGERFVIREMIEDQAYMEARVFFFDDVDEASDDNLADVADTGWKLLNEMADVDTVVDLSTHQHTISPKRLAYTIAALDGFSPAERQGFLEMTSASERLKKSVQALSRIVTRNRLTREIQQLIGGNGHPTQSILHDLNRHMKE